jgi:hypothetical protein
MARSGAERLLAGGTKQDRADKTPVVAFVQRASGTMRTPYGHRQPGEPAPVLTDNTDPRTTHLPDASKLYAQVAPLFRFHQSVNHTAGEYVRDGSTNEAESFLAQFKRSVDSSHHNVSKEHLHRYATRIRAPMEYPEDDRRRADTELHHQDRGETAALQATDSREPINANLASGMDSGV